MIKLIAVDMDGTFLNSKKTYNQERFAKIYEKMIQQNIKFVVASGNQYYQLKSFFPEIAKDISFVAENGALIISEEEELFCGQMSDELVTDILAFMAKQSDVSMIMCGRKSAYTNERESAEFVTSSRKYYHRLKVVPEITTAIDDIFFKVATNVPEDQTEEFIELFNYQFSGRLVAVTSGHGDIDLIIPGLHKANGLQLLQEKWQIDNSEIATFGDGGNDVEMLRHAKYGYAMANGSQRAKEAASFLAPTNEDEGVLTIMEELLNVNK